MLFSKQQEFEVLNMSINSRYAELGVTYLEDNKLVFASSKKLKTDKPFIKNRRKHNKELYLALFKGSINENGNIINSEQISNEIFNKFHEFDFSFTPDLKKIYFTSVSHSSKDKKKTLHIFSAHFNNNFELTNITPLRYNSKSYSVRNPIVTKDGKHLVISSNMKNGFGEYDLYILNILDNGTHSSPKNLGPNINTIKSELFPFIAEDNSLYFSSYGHEIDGSLNIYKSKLIGGVYQKPEKLPFPINSHSDDFGIVINSSINKGYFTSNRENGKGDVDIYAFKSKPELCFQTLSGLLVNESNGKPLDHTKITLTSNNDISQTKIFNNSFKFKLKCNEHYKLNINKKGFEIIEFSLQTSDQNEFEINKDFKLSPITCSQLLSGTVFNKETGQPLPNSKIKIFKNYKLTDSLLIDFNANYKYELVCNSTYRFSVSSKNYNSEFAIIKTSNSKNKSIIKNFHLNPNIEFVTIREQKMIYLKPVKFDLNESTIKKESKAELSKVVNILIKYPTIKLEINSHTDSRAPDNYNLNLSSKRVKSIINFLISKDINPHRISGHGYGETRLVNNCTNDVKCTESEHQLNRRTEFIVIDE